MKTSRYAIIQRFFSFFLVVSFIVRTVLLITSSGKADLSFASVLSIYGKGCLYDIAVAAFFCLPYAIYLLVLPQRWNNSRFDRWFTYIGFFLTVLIIMFSFFAEFTFWEEFECRFNFIAVDYLIYTYEVISNINQSYPLPLLIGGMLLATAAVLWLFIHRKAFRNSFQSRSSFGNRALSTLFIGAIAMVALLWLPNSWAESSPNRYRNELSKAGIYSFFAAFKNNELDYYNFYALADEDNALRLVRSDLREPNVQTLDSASIRRTITNSTSYTGKDSMQVAAYLQQPPNIILITVESFSADFMSYFGNPNQLTPHIDSLAKHGILFTNMYATGTRTVRGMEALTLSVPPTPGSSIVRRPDNAGLFNLASVFKGRGYRSAFIYGGDGYFDNMNSFFGNNGFDIIDRKRKSSPPEHLSGLHTVIPDSCVTFENAWGICDADSYDAAIRNADEVYQQGKPFFQFIMTTSNHRPFTYPEGKVDIPSGTSREGAVRYTDYAIADLMNNIRQKPWFQNTIVVIVADHCAGSAGKNEIDVSKYHIPAIIYNLQGRDSVRTISKQCSQIDLFPTLFALLGWDYESRFYGANVLDDGFLQRAFVGTYQKLGYVQGDSLAILSPQQKTEAFVLSADKTELHPVEANKTLLQRAIAYYQTAYYLYKNGGMKE